MDRDLERRRRHLELNPDDPMALARLEQAKDRLKESLDKKFIVWARTKLLWRLNIPGGRQNRDDFKSWVEQSYKNLWKSHYDNLIGQQPLSIEEAEIGGLYYFDQHYFNAELGDSAVIVRQCEYQNGKRGINSVYALPASVRRHRDRDRHHLVLIRLEPFERYPLIQDFDEQWM